MGLRSLYGQKRLGLKIEASGKAVDSRPTGDLKTREIEQGISRTKILLLGANVAYPFRDVKTIGFSHRGSIRRPSPIWGKQEGEKL